MLSTFINTPCPFHRPLHSPVHLSPKHAPLVPRLPHPPIARITSSLPPVRPSPLALISSLVLVPLHSLITLILSFRPSPTHNLRLLSLLRLLHRFHSSPPTLTLPTLPKAPFLLVANAQSPLDPLLLAFLRLDLRFVLPQKIFRFPILGWLLQKAGWIPVEDGRKGGMRMLDNAAGVVGNGGTVVLFPEGRIPEKGIMKRFASPAFKVAKKAKANVVPVTINWEDASVKVHQPIDQEGKTEKELAKLAEDVVRQALPKHLRGQ